MSPIRQRLRLLLPALGILLGGPRATHAQIVQGRITDELAGQPLHAVEVRLLTADDDVAAVAVSDSVGSYAVRAPRGGVYRVQADLLGYLQLRSPLLDLPEGRTVTADFEMPNDPIELEGLRVEVEAIERIREELRSYGVRVDALGEGFVDAETIASIPSASDFGKVLQWRSVPGMRVVRSDDVSVAARVGNPRVCVRLIPGRPQCAVTVLNGTRITLEAAYLVPAAALQAIAVLQPEDATTLYGTDGVGGAVLLFTR
jgi:hypothetical protein